MTLLIDVFLIVSVILVAWLGWQAGFTRSFFAALAGFAAMLAANMYPYKEGVNAYFVFLIAALFVILAGGFILRLVQFFYMNLVDKTCGAALGVLIWVIVAVNVVVPTLTQNLASSEGSQGTLIYKNISAGMHKKLPEFKNYIPPFLELEDKAASLHNDRW
ncbi:hypothetical protein [Endomicrobium proavitum]|uniref:Colicin V production protein n=1 Tax=Endomicrobium proavitum TaxID=1408281 RepID=A0A0G3WIY2_9BACT|nr:hypothetical protein [Endomicrobium proavitum]AKL98611.1 conserved membrane protein of unknown function [Endomicrobium proavitum]